MFNWRAILVWFVLICEATTTKGASGTTLSWMYVTSGNVATAKPECIHLEPFKHLFNIKGLDACEPHHGAWHHLDELTQINWLCRENIIQVMAARYGNGSTMSQYCSCKTHMWTDNNAQATSNKVHRSLDGVHPACLVYKGCRDLKKLYEDDTCAVHETIWSSLYGCPSDIYVEGQAVTCQAYIVKKMNEIYNGSLQRYENDRCYCYPNFGLQSVPSDCYKYGGFSRLQLNGLIPRNCITHFSIWKYLATQPVRCQDWIIKYMLDKTRDDFTCDCHDTDQSLFGRTARKRDTSMLPSCQQDSQGWNVLRTTFQSNQCHSHWYVWRHLADTHGNCRQYLINEMFAKFATTTGSSCHCKTLLLETTTKSKGSTATTTTTLPTTTITPPHHCFECNGSSCAISGSSVSCSIDQDFCRTSIIDHMESGKLVRTIERKCVSKQECNNPTMIPDSYCFQMDKGMFGYPKTCRFCCIGDNCNQPPSLIPPVSTLTSYPLL